MKNAGFADLSFVLYFEPEDGINNPREFTSELCNWAQKENRDLTVLEESMEPVIRLDGEKYICRLADPDIASQNNPVWKMACKQGITHSVGKYLGYKWVYLYKQ